MTNPDSNTEREVGEPISTVEEAEADSRIHYEPYSDGDNFQLKVGDEVFIDYTPAQADPKDTQYHEDVNGVIVDGHAFEREVEDFDGEMKTIVGHVLEVALEDVNVTVETLPDDDTVRAPVYSGKEVFDFPQKVFGVNATVNTEAAFAEMSMARAEAAAERKAERRRERSFY